MDTKVATKEKWLLTGLLPGSHEASFLYKLGRPAYGGYCPRDLALLHQLLMASPSETALQLKSPHSQVFRVSHEIDHHW